MYKILLVLLLFSSQQVAAAIVETPTLSQCIGQAESDSRGLDRKSVVYVFDIDNTVLALKNDFGSVQWYRWQRKLIEENVAQDRIANSVDELLAKQGLIYSLSSTYTPEADTSDLLNLLRVKLGHPVMYHTSRSLDVRTATRRELLKHQLFSGYAEWLKDIPGEFSFNEAPKGSRAVSFENGIFMSAGQDKGVFLNLLFKKLEAKPKHIVFVDDEEKNLVNVEREFTGKLPTTLCRYSAMDLRVNEFNASNKSEVNQLWKDFSELLSKL